jgi:hypothetical protein
MPDPIDTLPPAERDETLFYEGYHNFPSHCRMRVYTATEGTPVIVLTELPDSGTSVTNQAERAFYLAWRRIGSPEGGVYLIEHYPGWRANAKPDELGAEHLDWVQFDEANEAPVLEPCRVSGSVVGRQFCHPPWQWLPMADFLRLIGR